jgi:hypothetical protein
VGRAGGAQRRVVDAKERRPLALPAKALPTLSDKVERLFAWVGNVRRLVVRWEGSAENYLRFVRWGCVVILLRHLR